MEAIGLLVLFHLGAFVLFPLRFVRSPARTTVQGHCAGCGYALAGLQSAAVCPECGRSDPSAHVINPSRTLQWMPENAGGILVMLALWGGIALFLPPILRVFTQLKLQAIGFDPHAAGVWVNTLQFRSLSSLTVVMWAVSLGCLALSKKTERRVMSVFCVIVVLAEAARWGFQV